MHGEKKPGVEPSRTKTTYVKSGAGLEREREGVENRVWLVLDMDNGFCDRKKKIL